MRRDLHAHSLDDTLLGVLAQHVLERAAVSMLFAAKQEAQQGRRRSKKRRTREAHVCARSGIEPAPLRPPPPCHALRGPPGTWPTRAAARRQGTPRKRGSLPAAARRRATWPWRRAWCCRCLAAAPAAPGTLSSASSRAGLCVWHACLVCVFGTQNGLQRRNLIRNV